MTAKNNITAENFQQLNVLNKIVELQKDQFMWVNSLALTGPMLLFKWANIYRKIAYVYHQIQPSQPVLQ